MSKLLSKQYVRNNIEHCINELIFIVKHTKSFEDDPEKKKRQLARNESMRIESIKRLEDLVEEQKREYGWKRYQEGRNSVGGESIAEAWERGRRVGLRSFEMNDDSEYFKTRESIIETLCGILWMKTWSEAKQNDRRFETVMSFMRHFDKYVDKRIQDSYKPKDQNE